MSLRSRVIVLILLLLLGTIFISRTLQWYLFIPEEHKQMAMGSLQSIRDYAEEKATEEYQKLVQFKKQSKDFSAFGRSVALMLNHIVDIVGAEDIVATFESRFRDEILVLKDFREQTLQRGLDLQGGLYVVVQADFEALEKERGESIPDWEREDIMRQAMEILLNRIDQFGVTEPQIRRQLGTNRIIIELPGAADPERINKVIKGKGMLNFHLVNDEGEAIFQNLKNEHPEDYSKYIVKQPDETYKLKEPYVLPTDALLLGVYEKDEYGIDKRINYKVINADPELPGRHIQTAYARLNPQTKKPDVIFYLDDVGSEKFEEITGEQNRGKILAVVLDNKIKMAARINEPITGGAVAVTGVFTRKEADEMALILRTGELKVPLPIVEQNAVGAALGEDAINRGLNALLVGFILVVVFMFLYYKGAGLIANLALILNLFFLVSILSMTGFTLTLTSIAGILLTVGMSVDANVIIFERIKEEYRLGKSAKASVKAGYSKALWTILDANITTFIAAFVLSLLSKGSIQGFAFTLTVGIITSLITALFVSRIMFDFTTDVIKASKLSISWRPLS